MTKRATTLDEQISLLRSRGVEISSDENKIKMQKEICLMAKRLKNHL